MLEAKDFNLNAESHNKRPRLELPFTDALAIFPAHQLC